MGIKQNIIDDQFAIDVATAKLAVDQAALAALAPIEAALAEISSFADALANHDAAAQLRSMIAAATATLNL